MGVCVCLSELLPQAPGSVQEVRNDTLWLFLFFNDFLGSMRKMEQNPQLNTDVDGCEMKQ